MATPPLLVLDDVHVKLDNLRLLSSVSLTVEPGSAVGLVGETGSGKTMTIRAATGLLGTIGAHVTAGRIVLSGHDMTHATAKQWRPLRGRDVALVPQASMSSLDPVMTIERQLGETARLVHAVADVRSEVARVLDAVRLTPTKRLLRSYPHELSGGMRQRVMIALALITRPKLLIADEPTSALDASIRSKVLALLTDLRREHGLGLLLVSHDLRAIRAATDMTVVMYGGRTVETGPTDYLVKSPQHPYSRALLDASPDSAPPGKPLPVIPGQPPDPGEVERGCVFAPRCPRAQEVCSSNTPENRNGANGASIACYFPLTPGERLVSEAPR